MEFLNYVFPVVFGVWNAIFGALFFFLGIWIIRGIFRDIEYNENVLGVDTSATEGPAEMLIGRAFPGVVLMILGATAVVVYLVRIILISR